MRTLLAIVLTCCVGLAASQPPPQHKPEAPQIAPKKQADSGLKEKQEAKPNEKAASTPQEKGGHEATAGDKEPPETYVAFGKSLKVTDSLIALFTLVIAGFTIALFWDGHKTSKADLRAYVAIEEISHPPQMPLRSIEMQRVLVTVKNYGKTPAHDMGIQANFRIENGRSDSFPETPPQMLHPEQRVTHSVDLVTAYYQLTSPQGEVSSTSLVYFVSGRVVYRDIYTQWWRTDFAHMHTIMATFEVQPVGNRERGPFKTEEEAKRG